MVLSRALLSVFDVSPVLDGTRGLSGNVADRGHVFATHVIESAGLLCVELSCFIQEVAFMP
jgi:hypothetical protein